LNPIGAIEFKIQGNNPSGIIRHGSLTYPSGGRDKIDSRFALNKSQSLKKDEKKGFNIISPPNKQGREPWINGNWKD
jgi:hypothetical protein